jgi:hypothetical protein
MTKYEKYVDSDGNYFHKLKLENGSEFTVEKELGDYIHQLEQTVRGVLNTHNCMCGIGERVDGEHYCQKCLGENPLYCV